MWSLKDDIKAKTLNLTEVYMWPLSKLRSITSFIFNNLLVAQDGGGKLLRRQVVRPISGRITSYGKRMFLADKYANISAI